MQSSTLRCGRSRHTVSSRACCSRASAWVWSPSTTCRSGYSYKPYSYKPYSALLPPATPTPGPDPDPELRQPRVAQLEGLTRRPRRRLHGRGAEGALNSHILDLIRTLTLRYSLNPNPGTLTMPQTMSLTKSSTVTCNSSADSRPCRYAAIAHVTRHVRAHINYFRQRHSAHPGRWSSPRSPRDARSPRSRDPHLSITLIPSYTHLHG